MIYQVIAEKIEAGRLYLNDSISFKSLSSHLISDEKWKNKSELLGETSQHLIVSKLCSYKWKNSTKEAFWEYDKILMSIYLLNFINDPVMRQSVHRAFNYTFEGAQPIQIDMSKIAESMNILKTV